MAGFLALDLDRNHGKGENIQPDDGVSSLYAMFAGGPVPRVLEEIERTFPAYTLTPSGGYHLWFKFRSTEPFPSGEIAPGLEIHYDRATIYLPGSFKNGRPYIFKGDLDKAPELKSLPALYRLLRTAKQKNADKIPTPRPWSFQSTGVGQKQDDTVSLEFIAEWAEKNHPQMNHRLFSFSGWAYREGYTLDAVRSLVRTRWNLSGPDIDHATRPLENRS